MSFLHTLSQWANRLTSQQWLYVLIGVTIVGAMCLRGFGSRKNY
jgi:hypothetical protein